MVVKLTSNICVQYCIMLNSNMALGLEFWDLEYIHSYSKSVSLCIEVSLNYVPILFILISLNFHC